MIRLANVQRFRGNWIIIQPVPAALQTQHRVLLHWMIDYRLVVKADMATCVAFPTVDPIASEVLRRKLGQRSTG